MTDQRIGLEETDDGIRTVRFDIVLLTPFDDRLTEVLPMFPDASVTHHAGCSFRTLFLQPSSGAPMLSRRIALSLILAAFPLAAGGCFLVAAGAGAAGAIAYTNRGATSVVAGTVDQVFDRAVAAFQQSGITETGRSTEDSGRQRKLIGTRGEYEVTAELNRTADSTTKVEITARKSAVEYDKELAKDILNRILTTS